MNVTKGIRLLHGWKDTETRLTALWAMTALAAVQRNLLEREIETISSAASTQERNEYKEKSAFWFAAKTATKSKKATSVDATVVLG